MKQRLEVWKNKITAVVLVGVLVVGMAWIPEIGDSNGYSVVEAASQKKDKKRPVIKFSGKTKITIEKNKSVLIPKTTAKDNKDGNVTKKIKVSVKKGSKSYSSIAKKIKSNKKVKFTATGKYTITYTVTDKAGNKASKKRYVTVVEPKKETTTTEATTEEKTTEKITTEEKSTEEKESATPAIQKITLDNNTYNVTTDSAFGIKISNTIDSGKITFKIDNNFSLLYMDANNGIWDNFEFLKYYGSVKAYDENGIDISENIIICSPQKNPQNGWNAYVHFYVKDSNGNEGYINTSVFFTNKFESDDDYFNENHLISTNPIIYGSKR